MEHKYNKGSEWRKWDLHIHSNASDGKMNTTEIIDESHKKGLSVIALTDHHTAKNIDEIKQIGKAKGIHVISGIEFRTEYGSKSVHMIGLFPDKYNEQLLDSQSLHDLILAPLGLSETAIVNKGKELDNSLSNENAFAKGMFLLQVDFKNAANLIHKYGGIVSVHAGSKENSFDKEMKHQGTSSKNVSELFDSLGTVKEELLKDFIDICEIRKSHDSEQFYYEKFRKPSIIASDAHELEQIGEKYVWVKADPTFEGLRQIIYEPSDRVRLQETDPTLDFEKSPFTEIIIPEKTQVFNDDADLFFDATTIPLNNNLISIIGGRGTGKSMLINYLAAGLNKRTDKNSYNISDKITIKRKTSLSENEKDFVLSNDPNIPFMYIAQSQIKELVTDKSKFTKNIRETIGVIDDYKIPDAYLLEAENLINEYYRIIKIVNSNNEDIIEKKERIDLEIKKYVDFIANVTSEQNKVKLERYTKHIASINLINEWVERINLIKSSIQDFTTKTNVELASINDRFNSNGVLIPLLSAKDTIDYIETTVLPKFDQAKTKKQTEIDKTKEEFKGYSGDLSSLLSNISSYQTKLSELKSEKEIIEKEERLLVEIREEKFKLLGLKMEQSINDYTTQISEKWLLFKAGNPDLDTRKKEMLTSILGKDALNVSVKINFDTNKLYSLLMNKLDGRSFNVDKLKSEILKINTIDEFMKFVKQVDGKGVFDPQITSTLRSALIELFYKKHTNFITHEIVVTLNDKPITKLSHGQQGTIYLRLQIAANLFSETIVYDQPEDDLDNSFITEELVGIFKEIKKYRQVIIVSHNANLVVNADSEQVIIAKNEDGILKYTSGSLENTVINDSVCKVLEGGESAFRNRERKYHIHK